MSIFESGDWLPLVFAGLMGFSMLMYAILDGYDLGVGILLPKAGNDQEKDNMINSIGPFWDANETWLVLGVGILLVAFPKAHGVILTNLYMPVTVMIMGLIMRGVAFDFRIKAKAHYKQAWNTVFFWGSSITSISQGYMLGQYIVGFDTSLASVLFAFLVGICVAAGYALIGSTWLIMKTSNDLQKRAISWARTLLKYAVVGIVIVSITTPAVSPRIFDKWFSFPNILLLAPIPIATGVLTVTLEVLLRRLPYPQDKWCWAPFILTVGILVLCFNGLAYSFYPYIVPNQLKIVECTSSPESLKIILIGALVVLPVMIGYTALVYRIFHGKAEHHPYNTE